VSSSHSVEAAAQSLGPLEATLMGIVWEDGRSSVHEVCARVERPLAYTTVMTTLDRLYKKGLLERDKEDRAFYYRPAMTRQEWDLKLAGAAVERFLSTPEPADGLLISQFVDVMGRHDERLLDELERRIREKREELEEERKRSSR
jgi:predicted transcriptional regulator